MEEDQKQGAMSCKQQLAWMLLWQRVDRHFHNKKTTKYATEDFSLKTCFRFIPGWTPQVSDAWLMWPFALIGSLNLPQLAVKNMTERLICNEKRFWPITFLYYALSMGSPEDLGNVPSARLQLLATE